MWREDGEGREEERGGENEGEVLLSMRIGRLEKEEFRR